MYSTILFIDLEKTDVLDNPIIGFDRDQGKRIAGQG